MKSFALKTPLIAMLAAFAATAWAAPAGTLLFARGDLQIIDAAGSARVGKAGDLLQPGERVVTRDGAVCQIKLWDGSLVGVRPDTELKFELPEQASARAKHVIAIVKGGLRVVNVDLRDGRARVPVQLMSPTGRVDLTNADAESRVVSPEALQKAGVKDAGLYTRLQAGTGIVRTGTVEVPIALRTVTFTPRLDVAPTVIAAAGTVLFPSPTQTTFTTSLATTTSLEPKLTTTLSTATLDPKITTALSPTTSTLTSPRLTTSLTSPTLATTAPTTSLSSPTLTTTFTSPTLATPIAPTAGTTKPVLATIQPVTYVPPPVYIRPITTIDPIIKTDTNGDTTLTTKDGTTTVICKICVTR